MKDDNSKLIIKILVVVILLGAGIYAYLNVLGGKYNGKYYLKSMTSGTETFTAEDFKAYGYDVSDMCIKIKFRKAIFYGWGAIGAINSDGNYYNIKISGDKVTYYYKNTKYYGTYKHGELTIEADGTTLVFEKK